MPSLSNAPRTRAVASMERVSFLYSQIVEEGEFLPILTAREYARTIEDNLPYPLR